MERQLGEGGVHRFLKFDTEMFYFWCSFIGIENSKIIWREGVEAPAMGKLLGCINLDKFDLATGAGRTAMHRDAGRSLLRYIRPCVTHQKAAARLFDLCQVRHGPME